MEWISIYQALRFHALFYHHRHRLTAGHEPPLGTQGLVRSSHVPSMDEVPTSHAIELLRNLCSLTKFSFTVKLVANFKSNFACEFQSTQSCDPRVEPTITLLGHHGFDALLTIG